MYSLVGQQGKARDVSGPRSPGNRRLLPIAPESYRPRIPAMRNFSGILIAAAFAYLGVILFHEAHVAMAVEPEHVDQSRIVMLFGALVLTGLVAGGVLVSLFLPALGDWVGNFFFNPNERVEKAPHADALAAVARGDYERAVAEYRKCVESDENDTHALSEMVHLYCDKLGDPVSAESVIEEALAKDWAHDDAAFLSNRLAEVYWKYQHDAKRARELLMQVVETFPGTKHSANAQHRLQEIERQLATED